MLTRDASRQLQLWVSVFAPGNLQGSVPHSVSRGPESTYCTPSVPDVQPRGPEILIA